MKNDDTPEDGDFAAHLLRKAAQQKADVRVEEPGSFEEPSSAIEDNRRQTLDDVIAKGEEPTEAFLEDFAALQNAPEVSDEELERQALADPGADGDTSTPE